MVAVDRARSSSMVLTKWPVGEYCAVAVTSAGGEFADTYVCSWSIGILVCVRLSFRNRLLSRFIYSHTLDISKSQRTAAMGDQLGLAADL